MTDYYIQNSKKKLNLDTKDFIAKGGEGSVYRMGTMVAKICEDGKMIPLEKFKELRKIEHEHIIVPQEIITNGKIPVGYTMKLVPGNSKPLAQIITKNFRKREGVTQDKINNLVKNILDIVNYVHKHDGYLQVDGNEFNYMVEENFDEVYAIDTNSYQTPTFPATAIMPSIRDWHVKKTNGNFVFTKESDWYSFAVISFSMFTAIHPFKGRHPDFVNLKTLMEDNMKNVKSVLLPETDFPKGAAFFPFEDYIPGGKDGAYMNWYRAVFVDNKRLCPPSDFQAKASLKPTVQVTLGSNQFELKKVNEFKDDIIGYFNNFNKEVFITSTEVIYDQKIIKKPEGKLRIVFSKQNEPIMAVLKNEKLQLTNLVDGEDVDCEIGPTDFFEAKHALYCKVGDMICELSFTKVHKTISNSAMMTTVLPHATNIYQGVLIQDMYGTKIASFFPEKGFHFQKRIIELEDKKIIEAKCENNILMVIAYDKSINKHERMVFVFSENYEDYTLRSQIDVNSAGLNFIVLKKHFCVSMTEDESLVLFRTERNTPSVRKIKDPALTYDMRLYHDQSKVKVAIGRSFYEMTLNN